MNRRHACLGLLALAAGCAHIPVGTDGLSFAERRDRLLALDRWQLQGRIAVDTGERAFQGGFQWLLEPAGISLTVRGPLGAGAVRVEGNADRLLVTTRGEVQSLRYWLLGLPDPAYAASTEFGRDGVVAELSQRLWDVSYDDYMLAAQVLMPQRIGLRHGELNMRVTLDRFEAATLN
jgi:outer membrane lipoprotein LolB